MKPPEGDSTFEAKLPKDRAGAGASAALTCSAIVLAVCRCASRGAAAMEGSFGSALRAGLLGPRCRTGSHARLSETKSMPRQLVPYKPLAQRSHRTAEELCLRRLARGGAPAASPGRAPWQARQRLPNRPCVPGLRARNAREAAATRSRRAREASRATRFGSHAPGAGAASWAAHNHQRRRRTHSQGCPARAPRPRPSPPSKLRSAKLRSKRQELK